MLRSLAALALLAAATSAAADERLSAREILSTRARSYGAEERCVGPGGAGAVFREWVGESTEAVVLDGPARMNLLLGHKANERGRQVVVRELGRSGEGGLRVARVVASNGFGDNEFYGLALTPQVDAYLLAFEPPMDSAEPDVRCVLSFADVWAWRATQPGAFDAFAQVESFQGATVSTLRLRELLGGADQPLPLRLEPVAERGAAPGALRSFIELPGRALTWSGEQAVEVVSATSTARAMDVQRLWLCAGDLGYPEGQDPVLAMGDTARQPKCLLLRQYEFDTSQPLTVVTKTEALQLSQSVHVGRMDPGGLVPAISLLRSPDEVPAREFVYPPYRSRDVLPGALAGRSAGTQAIDYVVGLVGSVDAGNEDKPCPAEPRMGQPLNLFAPVDGRAGQFDVHACLYRRRGGGRFDLVRAGATTDADGDLLASVRLLLCDPVAKDDACAQAARLDAGHHAFRLDGRSVRQLELRVAGVPGAPLQLDRESATLASHTVNQRPWLPPAGSEAGATVRLARLAAEELEAQAGALCLRGAWVDRYPSAALDLGASVVVQSGEARLALETAKWVKRPVDGSDRFCPELSDEQRTQVVAFVRDHSLAGERIDWLVLQGGRMVSRASITGPSRPPIESVQWLSSDGKPVSTLPADGSFGSDVRSLCLLTDGDWGEQIPLDPSAFVVRGDAGEPVAALRTEPAGARVSFQRRSKADEAGRTTYCAPLNDKLSVRRLGAPAPTTGELSVWLDDGQGCAGGREGRPCATLGLERTTTALMPFSLPMTHVGVAFGQINSIAGLFIRVPSVEQRVFVAAPLALWQYRFPGLATFSAEAGAQVSLTSSSEAFPTGLVSRNALALGGYGAVCMSATVVKRWSPAVPRLCGQSMLDLPAVSVTRSPDAPQGSVGGEFGALGFFISLGVGGF